jgi:hypothetical protein
MAVRLEKSKFADQQLHLWILTLAGDGGGCVLLENQGFADQQLSMTEHCHG